MRKYLCLILLLTCLTLQSANNSPRTQLIHETQQYLDKFNSPLNARKLVDLCIKHDVPVSLALAQGHQESHLGTRGQARKTFSVWGVGAWDTSPVNTKKRTRYKSFDDSIEPYIRLVRSYIDERGYPGILKNFSRGKYRYAGDPNYETKIRAHIDNINKNTNIRKLYIQCQKQK